MRFILILVFAMVIGCNKNPDPGPGPSPVPPQPPEESKFEISKGKISVVGVMKPNPKASIKEMKAAVGVAVNQLEAK